MTCLLRTNENENEFHFQLVEGTDRKASCQEATGGLRRSALAEQLLEPRAALGRAFAVKRGQLGHRLRVPRLRLHRLAVHRLGAALELARAVELTERHV